MKTGSLTWYVLSKLSYMNLVINEVFPTKTEIKIKGKIELFNIYMH